MELSINSWHYRQYEYWLHNSASTKAQNIRYSKIARPTLCLYFWVAVLRSPLLRTGRWMKSHPKYAALLNVLWFLLVITLALSTAPELTMFTAFLQTLRALGILLAAAAVLAGLAWLVWFLFGLKEDGALGLTETLPAQYIKAKKQKVCPFIEFVDPA